MGLFSKKTDDEKFMEKCSKADELLERDRYDEALEKFLEAEEILTKVRFTNVGMLSNMFCNMSRCHYFIVNKMLDEQNKRAIELGFDPKKLIGSAVLGSNQMIDPYQKRFLKGVEYSDKSIDIGPQNPQAWFWKGINLEKIYRDQEISFSMGPSSEKPTRTKDAIECYEKAVSLDPTYQIAWFHLAMLLNVEKEFEKCIECYDKSIKINPDSDTAKLSWNNMGCAYDALFNREEADKCYANAREFDSSRN